MDITQIYSAMSAYTEIVGNIMIVCGFAGLVILGRAIYKTYFPEGVGILKEED